METNTVTDDDLPSRLRHVLDKTPATQEELAHRADVSLKWVNNVKNAPPGKTFDKDYSERLRKVLDQYLAEHVTDLDGLIEEFYEPGNELSEALLRIAERMKKRRP